MPRVLADGHVKFTILTVEPAGGADAPSAAELNAGIDLSCKVLASDFNWSAADSEKISEPALCDNSNANSLGKSNYTAGFTLWRYFLDGGGVDPTEDAGFTAVQTKGTTLFGYARLTDKDSTDDWADGDEIYLGAEFTVDTLQRPSDQGGWLKWRVPGEIQRAYDFISVGGASAAPTVVSLTPATGAAAGGTSVTIHGSGFTLVTGATGVKFLGTNATSYTIVNDNYITAVSPAHAAGTGNVTVTNPTGTSATGAGNQFIYT